MVSPLLPSGSRKFSYHRPPVSDINVTPFVDVMLVLLIVFMITAPMMTQGIQLELPSVQNKAISAPKEPIQVSIKRNGTIYIQKQKVSTKKLVARLKAIRGVRTDAAIMLRADKAVSYGKVMQVMGALQTAGLTDIGLVTDQPALR